MAAFYLTPKLDGFDFPDFQMTVKLAAGITVADIGKALTWDASSPNQMKLAGDGDSIDADLKQVEARDIEGLLLGTVGFRFATLLPIKAGLTSTAVVAVGSRVVGAGAGEIKATTNADPLWGAAPRVVELRSTYAVVLKV